MGRKKRSEKAAEGAVRPAPVEVKPLPMAAERIIAALCPCCGRTIPENRAIKIGYVTVDRVPYFGSIDWDENKPFGVSLSAAGRGSLKEWRHIGPEEAPELFEAVKARFLQAIKEWLGKGWIKPEELPG